MKLHQMYLLLAGVFVAPHLDTFWGALMGVFMFIWAVICYRQGE